MTIAAGIIAYSLGAPPVSGCGLVWNDEELDTALTGAVKEVFFDESGKADIAGLLAGVAETDFAREELEKILTDPKPPEDWRVGEALAECYLVQHKHCFFPWPDGRDERKTGSSLPGADLVGLHNENGEDYFAFGEIKTSTEEKYPPGAMHGRTGLKQQLEDLKESSKIKDDLVKYLGYRAVTAAWKEQYQNAARNFLQDKNAVRVFGVLIRDVAPHQDDLRVRVEKLGQDMQGNMKIELLAIYLPMGKISSLSSTVMASKAGGAT
jgi:hypothetical protein